jgi:DNA invertase Pin-like site-specific DNA recombinase
MTTNNALTQSAASVHNSEQEVNMNRKITILYERLSRDDPDAIGESNSIKTQRAMLEEYAERHGFVPYEHLTDDGFSGVNFNRPGWQELIARVERDEVGIICLKDSSRMARNYLQAGLYREMFRERNVRLICVNDNTDTANGEDDFTPFREIMSEWYARDCSRKIKSAFATKGKAGKPLTNKVIYGYRKDPNDKHKWIVDPVSAAVVRRIFDLTVEGHGTFQIASMLHKEKVEYPSYYQAMRGYVAYKTALGGDDPYAWCGATIISILRKPEYAGHTVNFRTSKPSFKSKKFIEAPQKDWLIFPNTHEAIVSQETWDLVQKVRKTTRRTDTTGVANPLTGLVICADCGSRLYNHRGSYNKDRYICGNYTNSYNISKIRRCTQHYITTEALQTILLDVLKGTIGYVREHETDFVEKLREASALQQGETMKSLKRQIAKNKKRIDELDKLFNTLYEDKVKGILGEERFIVMSGGYEHEQSGLRTTNATLSEQIESFNANSKNADNFISLVRRFTEITELSSAIINELVDKIVVHESVWSEGRGRGRRSQKVDVYLKYIGVFDLPDLRSPEEIEAERIAEEKKEHKRALGRARNRRHYAKKRAAQEEAKIKISQQEEVV